MLLVKFINCMPTTYSLSIRKLFFSLMHTLKIYTVGQYFVNLYFMYFWYESGLLTCQDSVIFGVLCFGWKSSCRRKAQVIICPCLRRYSSLSNCHVLFFLFGVPAKDYLGIKRQLFLNLKHPIRFPESHHKEAYNCPPTLCLLDYFTAQIGQLL